MDSNYTNGNEKNNYDNNGNNGNNGMQESIRFNQNQNGGNSNSSGYNNYANGYNNMSNGYNAMGGGYNNMGNGYTNSVLGIISLITSLLCCCAPIGLVLAIIDIVVNKNRKHTCAKIAIGCSIVVTILSVVGWGVVKDKIIELAAQESNSESDEKLKDYLNELEDDPEDTESETEDTENDVITGGLTFDNDDSEDDATSTTEDADLDLSNYTDVSYTYSGVQQYGPSYSGEVIKDWTEINTEYGTYYVRFIDAHLTNYEDPEIDSDEELDKYKEYKSRAIITYQVANESYNDSTNSGLRVGNSSIYVRDNNENEMLPYWSLPDQYVSCAPVQGGEFAEGSIIVGSTDDISSIDILLVDDAEFEQALLLEDVPLELREDN